MKNRLLAFVGALVVLGMAATPLWAHPGHEAPGLAGGIMHPFTGLDHLLAFVGAGIWLARLDKRRAIGAAAALIGALLVGAVLGASELMAGIEPMLAITVVLVGLVIVCAVELPLPVFIAMFIAFGLFHGAAHGAELSSRQVSTLLGIVLGSTCLLGVGWTGGKALRRLVGESSVELAGGGIAAAGLAMLVSAI